MELLKALANPANQGILVVLAAEPSYARRLAPLLDMTETQVTRNLRAMEALGLVQSAWEHIGANVKMYRPTAARFTIRFDPEGMHVEVDATEGARAAASDRLVDPFEPRIPEVGHLVGREELLDVLGGKDPVIGLEGIAGIGKTSVMAVAARRDDHPVFWHAFRGVESLTWLLNRLAVFLASHGHNGLLHTIQADAELAERRERLLETFDQAGVVLYFDDVHAIEDDRVRSLLRDLAATATHSRIRMAGRTSLPIATDRPGATIKVVPGLEADSARELLHEDGVDLEDAAVLDRVGGHPLALHLLADVLRTSNTGLADLLDGAPPGPLVDFLLREVDAGLADGERRVLAHASIFRTAFKLDALQALTRAPGATLLRLQQKHLLEAAGGHYVMHDLVRSFFARFLDDPAAMHAKAAAHFQESGSVEGHIEAMHHLMAAGRDEKVLRLLESNLDLHDFDLIDAGYSQLYLDVLSRFREDAVTPRAWALIQDELGDLHFQEEDYATALEHYAVADVYFRAHKAETTRDEDLAWKRAMALDHLGRRNEAQSLVAAALDHAPEGKERDRLEGLQVRLGD